MTTATSTVHNLDIEGMTGEVCIKEVTGALTGVPGVSIQNVKVGTAAITCDQDACTAACAAVETAGYKCRESRTPSTRDGSANATGRNGATRETNQQTAAEGNASPANPSKYGASSRDAAPRDSSITREGANARDNDNARDGAAARATNLARDNAGPQEPHKKADHADGTKPAGKMN